MMTNDEHERLTAALTRKIERMGFGTTDEAVLEQIVGNVIADTMLVCAGVTTIEDYEAR